MVWPCDTQFWANSYGHTAMVSFLMEILPKSATTPLPWGHGQTTPVPGASPGHIQMHMHTHDVWKQSSCNNCMIEHLSVQSFCLCFAIPILDLQAGVSSIFSSMWLKWWWQSHIQTQGKSEFFLWLTRTRHLVGVQWNLTVHFLRL